MGGGYNPFAQSPFIFDLRTPYEQRVLLRRSPARAHAGSCACPRLRATGRLSWIAGAYYQNANTISHNEATQDRNGAAARACWAHSARHLAAAFGGGDREQSADGRPTSRFTSGASRCSAKPNFNFTDQLETHRGPSLGGRNSAFQPVHLRSARCRAVHRAPRTACAEHSQAFRSRAR